MGLLEGKVAIITGAGGGLGSGYAKLLAREGASVVVNDFDEAAAAAVVSAIQEAGGQAVASVCDVSKWQSGETILKVALDTFGRVDILVNNAGILRDKGILGITEDMWDAVVDVHLKGTFCVTQPIFRWMREHEQGGVIINTSSASGLSGSFGQTNYSAAKAGIWGFSHSLALEGKKFGIRVWTLVPAAATAMTAKLLPAELQEAWAAEYVAPVVLYMASPLSGDKTGHTLFASGSKVMELKLTAAAGIRNGKGMTAQDIAAAQAQILLPESAVAVDYMN